VETPLEELIARKLEETEPSRLREEIATLALLLAANDSAALLEAQRAEDAIVVLRLAVEAREQQACRLAEVTEASSDAVIVVDAGWVFATSTSSPQRWFPTDLRWAVCSSRSFPITNIASLARVTGA
jgi:hypothetical protein